MSYSDRFKKVGSGGFLNNVDGEVTSVTFTTATLDGSQPAKGEAVALWAKLAVKQDNQDEEVVQHLKVCGTGGDSDWKISKDGKTATPTQDQAGIWDTEDGLSKFMVSLVEDGGYAEEDMPEPVGAPLNFTFLEGERFRFVQKPRTDDWALANPRKDKKDPKKTYKRTYTAVSEHYTSGTDKSPTARVATMKGDAKSGADVIVDSAIAAKALKTLKAVLQKAPRHTLWLSDLKLKIQTALMGDGDRNAVWAYLADDDHLAHIQGIEYDPEAKDPTVSLV